MSPRDTPDNNKKGRAKGVPGRGDEDNVTYVNFGKRRKVESAEETLPEKAQTEKAQPEKKQPERALTRESIEEAAVEFHNRQQPRWSKRITSDKPRDSIFNPAAERIMKFVTTTTDSGRLARGRQYARSGHVVDLDLRVSAV
ncbi:MAG: tungsten formylmethanofuran dehydrogenase, partial [Corynebacterium casei]|nr:tungsten formylmethanofuran dehydrogenase [Corynebacterium casei]